MNELLNCCKLCPKNCGVNRNKQELGFCKASNKLKIAKYSLHMWEEPCISGEKGSGTIFFSNCNLKCIFCQNYYISTLNNGEYYTVEEFANICIELQNRGANNINLVTPTHYVPLIVDGLKIAKKKGLTIPIIYNSSAYENIETIKLLNGIVDVYLPDLKYINDEISKKYSGIDDYFKYASLAIEEMYKQQTKCLFNTDGIIEKGVIVRHLLLPNMEEDSKKILKYLYTKYKDNIYISIMNQYTPIRCLKYKELNDKVSERVYDEVIDYAWNLGIRNAFTQEEGTQSESFIPDFK
ncbi:MAG: radical SAM protein [Bacilli bacterium]|nr:radical SAM protein [Bacilli bacterium]